MRMMGMLVMRADLRNQRRWKRMIGHIHVCVVREHHSVGGRWDQSWVRIV